jgi:predicted component of type VI protein secretion system
VTLTRSHTYQQDQSRGFALARAGWAAIQCGTALRQKTEAKRLIIGILAARNLLQAVVTDRSPTARVLRVGAAVDLTHAASMIGLALAGRSPGLTVSDGTVAGLIGVAGLRIAANPTTIN